MRGTVKQLNKGSKINAIILSKLPLFLFWHYHLLTAETQIHHKHNHLPYICA
jgi:hypothetical protein